MIIFYLSPFVQFISYIPMYYYIVNLQLEAIIRMSESLAKMELKPFASITHVNEAIRLFKVCY